MEAGIKTQTGQPVMGQGAGGKAVFLPVCTMYQLVPASKSASALGPAGGAIGDYLESLVVIPANSNVGAISVADGGGSSIAVFTGGPASVSDLKPFIIPIKAYSTSGLWSVTTSNNAAVLANGNFT